MEYENDVMRYLIFKCFSPAILIIDSSGTAPGTMIYKDIDSKFNETNFVKVNNGTKISIAIGSYITKIRNKKTEALFTLKLWMDLLK